MANANAILGGVAAAAPGIAQGVQGVQGMMAQNQVNKQAPAIGQASADAAQAMGATAQPAAMTPDQLDAGQTGAPSLATDSHPMSDASHPFWNVMQSVAGAIPATPAGATGATQGLQNGGVVKANYGRPVIQPEFTRGPARPTGPNDTAIPSFTQAPQAAAVQRTGYEAGGVVNSSRQQAIQVGVGRDQTGIGQSVTDPSTEGQMLTMAGGGVVPGYDAGGFVNPGAAPSVPMTGPAAGFVQGFGQGEVLGRNLLNQFHEHEARKQYGESAATNVSYDPEDNNGQGPQQAPSMLDRARDAVEGFFHHMHEGTLNDQHMPNGPTTGAVPTGGQPPGAAPPGQPAQPPAGQPPVSPVQAAVPGVGGPQVPGAAPAQPGAQGIQTSAQGPIGWQKGTGHPSNPADQFAGGTPPQPSPDQQSAATQKTATAVAAQAASVDPQASAGIPQQSPEDSGKPHSLTTDYWRESNQKMAAAVRAAAMAGEDPQKVYDSLTAMRTAHFQGQILRQLSAANTALLNGDEKSVRQALSNVNYYLPNGQGITFKNATEDDVKSGAATSTGQLMYRNPMYGLYGHQKEPQYTTVTPQHLQLLGASALDPRTVQETMLKTYSAQAQAQKEMLQAQGEFMTGQGRQAWGQAAVTKSQVDKQMVPVNSFLKKMLGVEAASKAGYYDSKTTGAAKTNQPKVSMASIQSAQKAAMAAVDANSQGNMNSIPLTDVHGVANPAGGRPYHDPTKIPTLYQDMSPDQVAATRGFAGTFAAANPGLSPQDAADLAARVVKAGNAKAPQVHINPATKKPEKDVAPDPKHNSIHIWVGNGYKTIWVQPNVLAAEEQGIPVGEEGGGTSFDDTAPAVEPSDSNQMG